MKPRRRWYVLAALASGALTLSVVLIVLLSLNRKTGVAVTWDRLEEAQSQWKAAGPANYDIEVSVTGPREAIYRVQVRDGEAIGATIDGRSVPQQRTYGVWSVPGMFATIGRDLEHIDRRESGKADRTARLTLYGEFDATNGIPLRYHRIEWGEAGSDLEVTWEVTSFEIVSEKAGGNCVRSSRM